MHICMCDELEMLAGQLDDQLQPTRMETEDLCALSLMLMTDRCLYTEGMARCAQRVPYQESVHH